MIFNRFFDNESLQLALYPKKSENLKILYSFAPMLTFSHNLLPFRIFLHGLMQIHMDIHNGEV
jgi:hypothetical protein